ncbi:MAG: molecular chaperone DnaK [candidate division SR1 bacterium]|nr:molecular chaperone DnaK [candidate division SR1 bacterium]
MAKIIGIDLGTTNSCVSYMLGDKSEVIANAEGKRTTPSVVYIKGDELLVGDLAKRKAILEPKNVIYEVKRFIGRKYSEVIGKENLPYEIKEGKDGGVLIVIDGKEYKPEQISAFIIQKLKEDAEKFLGTPITQAVITTPAYFNDSQRNATKASGEIAGLKVERIVNEPTAASLAYGEGKNKDEKIVVFDLGGGTFDVTILEIGAEGTFQVLSTSGDTHLGGADFDHLIINYLVDAFKKKEGIDLTKNAMAMQRVKNEAEAAKHQLSQTERVDISVPFIITGEDGLPRNMEESLTRAQFENMCKDLFERCKKPCLNALEDSKLKKSDLNQVILVGGSTRMPAVLKLVKDIFGIEPKATVNPDESVSQGAAIQAGIIQGDVKDILLLDVTPLSLSVEVEGGIAHTMIARNTTIPAKKENTFTTAADNQTAVTVHVTQGERQFARDNIDRKRRELVESKNRLEALVYQMETMIAEQKDKIPDEDKEKVNKLIADAKSTTGKEGVAKEEIDSEIERIQKEFAELYNKYQAAPAEGTPNPDSELEKGKEEGTVEGEVIDADAK